MTGGSQCGDHAALVTAGGFEDHQASPRREATRRRVAKAVAIIGDGEVTFRRQETHVERVLGDVDTYYRRGKYCP